MYMYECIDRTHVCANVCVRACARAGVVCPSVRVRLYRRSCIEACTDAQVRTRARASAAPSAFGGSHTLVHARMDGCIYMRVSMAWPRRACIGMHVYVYIYDDVYIPIVYLLCPYTYACMHACVSVWIRCAHRLRCECVYADRFRAYRCVHVYLAPSVQLNV
jgi:hypothetical protein